MNKNTKLNLVIIHNLNAVDVNFSLHSNVKNSSILMFF